MRQTGSYSVLSCWPWSSRFGASAGCAGAAAPAARPAAAARGTALRAKRTAPEKNKGGEPPPLFFLRTIEQNGNFSESFCFAFQTEDKAMENASTCRGESEERGRRAPFLRTITAKTGTFREVSVFAFQAAGSLKAPRGNGELSLDYRCSSARSAARGRGRTARREFISSAKNLTAKGAGSIVKMYKNVRRECFHV